MEQTDIFVDIPVAAHIAFRCDRGEIIAPPAKRRLLLYGEISADVRDPGFFQPGLPHQLRAAFVAGIEGQHCAGEPFRHCGEQLPDILFFEIIENTCGKKHRTIRGIDPVHPADIIQIIREVLLPFSCRKKVIPDLDHIRQVYVIAAAKTIITFTERIIKPASQIDHSSLRVIPEIRNDLAAKIVLPLGYFQSTEEPCRRFHLFSLPGKIIIQRIADPLCFRIREQLRKMLGAYHTPKQRNDQSLLHRVFPDMVFHHPNSPFFSLGADSIPRQVYPVASIASFRAAASATVSVRKVASFFLREAETFFASGTAFRIVSQICASHIPHIIPSIFIVVLIMSLTSFLSVSAVAVRTS